METGSKVSAALSLSFFLFSGAMGLLVIGVITYFLVTLNRIAKALEDLVEAVAENQVVSYGIQADSPRFPDRPTESDREKAPTSSSPGDTHGLTTSPDPPPRDPGRDL
ncbi:MAG: hypothetical protein HY318_14145 [Armatimonadetes bacterium]|nr:hypothetical protein [Armatimonadota bacterium]